MKHGKKQLGVPAPAGAGKAGTNPRRQAQTRQQLRTHYAAKYRAR